jgi:ribosome maturation factor RimP
VSAENRLTAEQFAALRPGKTVTVESGAEFGRRRYVTATVVRVNGSHVVVSCEGSPGREVRRALRPSDGVRRGGGHAELVDVDFDGPATREHLRRRTQRIDTAYRQWIRRRADVDALRELHDAVSEALDEHLAAQR